MGMPMNKPQKSGTVGNIAPKPHGSEPLPGKKNSPAMGKQSAPGKGDDMKRLPAIHSARNEAERAARAAERARHENVSGEAPTSDKDPYDCNMKG